MSISDLLLLEFDAEAKATRTALERVPEDNKDFTPHPKSMPLNKLAPHVAELGGFGLTILTTPELDFSKGSRKRVAFESASQLVQVFDDGAAQVRAALKSLPDSAWTENWKLSFQGKPVFSGSRFLAYRQMIAVEPNRKSKEAPHLVTDRPFGAAIRVHSNQTGSLPGHPTCHDHLAIRGPGWIVQIFRKFAR